MLAGQLAQLGEEPRARQQRLGVPEHRLHDDRRDAFALALEHPSERLDVVEGHRDDGLRDDLRDPAALHEAERIVAFAQLGGLVGRGERVVMDPVVATFELDDPVATGEGARDAHGVHRRLGARDGQAGHLAEGQLGDQLAGLDLVLARQAEADAAREALDDVGIDPLVGVAEDGRAIAHAQVDVLVAVEVPDASTLAALDVDRVVAPDPEVGVGTAGHRAQRALIELRLSPAGEGCQGMRGHVGSSSRTPRFPAPMPANRRLIRGRSYQTRTSRRPPLTTRCGPCRASSGLSCTDDRRLHRRAARCPARPGGC